jgi:hypothetical protein
LLLLLLVGKAVIPESMINLFWTPWGFRDLHRRLEKGGTCCLVSTITTTTTTIKLPRGVTIRFRLRTVGGVIVASRFPDVILSDILWLLLVGSERIGWEVIR